MSDLSLIPLQDGFETQLSQDWDGNTGTIYVLATPSYTPTTTNTYIVVNPGKTNMQIAEITDYDSTAKTLTVSSISFEKGLGISSTAQTHSTGSKVIISDNYQFWEDIQTAINTKLDDTGGTMTGLLQFTGTTHAGIKLLSLTTTQRDALSASNGMLIYNSTTGEVNQYIGGAWSAVAAGSTQPTASTTVLGKIKTDVTPAGDPVALIQDNPKYDALAGTSGTPSSTNKYVTNDDTATAATADKVARRLAGGNIAVVTETQGNNSTNAASTAYVDTAVGALGVSGALPFFFGAGGNTTAKTYWNYDIKFISGSSALWTGTNVASVVSYVDWIDIASFNVSNNDFAYTAVVYRALNTQYAFNSTKKIIVEFFAQCNSVGTDALSWGLCVSSGFQKPYNNASDDGVLFTVDPATSKLYAHTSGGTGTTDHTETEITGITLTNENRYRIELDPASAARFYVNGVLKATITTTLPNSGDVLVGVGSDYVSGSLTNRVRYFTAPNISVEK